MLFEDSGSFTHSDEELMMGASYGSNVTVSEVICTASAGGGMDVIVMYDYFQENIQGGGDVGAFDQWTDDFKQEVSDFGAAHVQGDPNTIAYQQARQAMEALYATAKLSVLSNSESFFPATPGETLTWTELVQSLESTIIVVGVHDYQQAPAFTLDYPNGGDNIIYIDPNRLSSYVNAFGVEEGTNYVIYHELAHASVDGEDGQNLSNREPIANEYGQMLAGIVGAAYPTDTELGSVGGTVSRQ